MTIWIWIALFSLLASVAVVIATAFVYAKSRGFGVPVSALVSFAVGTLLASAMLGLVPKALNSGNQSRVLGTVLLGLLLFFALEKGLIWRHCHKQNCAEHTPAGPLILVGDAFHNFVDGVVIASAFLSSIPTGVSASLAVIAHEVPQEIGDFAVLTNSGYSNKRAALMNCLSSATTPLGALLGGMFLTHVSTALPYVLAISAASFLYIGIADLIPHLHREGYRSSNVAQFVCVTAGMVVIAGLRAGLKE